MTLEEIVLTKVETEELEKLKDDFNIRYQRSPAKKALLGNEIKGYSLLFDDDKLPLQGKPNEYDVPLKGFSMPEFCSMEIMLIREFWMHFIIEGNDIAEVDKLEPDSWYWHLNDIAPEWLTNPKHYYSTAVIYFKYLYWLNMRKEGGIRIGELALLKVYESVILKRDGSKLYQRWAWYSKKVNRTGAEGTLVKNKNKIELFDKVIAKLSGDQKKHAEEDLKELKKNIDNQYFGN